MARKQAAQSTQNQVSETDGANAAVSHEEDLFGFLVVSYVLHRLDVLSPESKARLDAVFKPGKPTWIRHVEKCLQIKSTFVEQAFDLCTETMKPEKAILFILRGVDCPNYRGNLEMYMNETRPNRPFRGERAPSVRKSTGAKSDRHT
jgi:hypothetical protein